MNLIQVPGSYSIIRLEPEHPIPHWMMKSRFYSLSKSDEELSIVCESSVIPEGEYKREDNWICLKVEGTLDFSLTGELSYLVQPLAEAKVSVFAISTFNTDYLLVKEIETERTISVLESSGFSIDRVKEKKA